MWGLLLAARRQVTFEGVGAVGVRLILLNRRFIPDGVHFLLGLWHGSLWSLSTYSPMVSFADSSQTYSLLRIS